MKALTANPYWYYIKAALLTGLALAILWLGYRWGHADVAKARDAQKAAEAARDQAITNEAETQARYTLAVSQMTDLSSQAEANATQAKLWMDAALNAATEAAKSREDAEARIADINAQTKKALANPDCKKLLEAKVCGLELH